MGWPEAALLAALVRLEAADSLMTHGAIRRLWLVESNPALRHATGWGTMLFEKVAFAAVVGALLLALPRCSAWWWVVVAWASGVVLLLAVVVALNAALIRHELRRTRR